MTEFIIRTITNKQIVVIQHASEILAELKRQGNNLNQAVRNNYYGAETEKELNDCVTELKKTYHRMIEAIGGSDAVT